MRLDFDSDTVESDQLPPGTYTAAILESELKVTKSGGQALKLDISVLEGRYKGWRISDMINLKHPKKDVEKIALQKLKRYTLACGLKKITDSEELHARPFVVEVVQNGDFVNVKKVMPRKAASPAAAALADDAVPF
jgi:hypothetical protein